MFGTLNLSAGTVEVAPGLVELEVAAPT